MRELLEILLGFAGVAVLVWLFLKLGVFVKEEAAKRGLDLPTRPEVPKVEIQTLFHGNSKDEDQI